MPSQETTNAITEKELAALKKTVDDLEAAVKGLQQERHSALKWGIMTLGSIVLGMGVWIFNYVTGHLK